MNTYWLQTIDNQYVLFLSSAVCRLALAQSRIRHHMIEKLAQVTRRNAAELSNMIDQLNRLSFICIICERRVERLNI